MVGILVGGMVPGNCQSPLAQPTTVIILRHAERL
jgi:hypothetical protein